MDGGIEQPLPSALRRLPIAWVFLDVRNEPRVEDCFAIVPGVESTIQVKVRTVLSLAMRFNAFSLSGRSAVSDSLTGTTGTGANTKPLLSMIARIFSPF